MFNDRSTPEHPREGLRGVGERQGSTSTCRSMRRRAAARSRWALIPIAIREAAVPDGEEERMARRQRPPHPRCPLGRPTNALNVQVVLLRPERRHGRIGVGRPRGVPAGDGPVVLRVTPVLQPHRARAGRGSAPHRRRRRSPGPTSGTVRPQRCRRRFEPGRFGEAVVGPHAGAHDDEVRSERVTTVGHHLNSSVRPR